MTKFLHCKMSDQIYVKIKDLLLNKCKTLYSSNKTIKYQHMCCITNIKGDILSYGYNVYSSKSRITEHAESNAMRKFSHKFTMDKTNKKIKINFIIVRLNEYNSKPCIRCINNMINMSHKISIKYIFYTHEDEKLNNGLKCDKLRDLINDTNKHICSFDRNKQRNINTKTQNKTQNTIIK